MISDELVELKKCVHPGRHGLAEPRTHKRSVSLTKKEMQQIEEEKAKVMRGRQNITVGEYMRIKLLDDTQYQHIIDLYDQHYIKLGNEKDIKALAEQTKKISTSLNQIAKFLNTQKDANFNPVLKMQVADALKTMLEVQKEAHQLKLKIYEYKEAANQKIIDLI